MLKNYINTIIKKKKIELNNTKSKKKSETGSKKSENFSNQIIQLEFYNMNTTNQEQTNQSQERTQELKQTDSFQFTEEDLYKNFDKFQELFFNVQKRKEQEELERKEERYKQIDEEIDELEKQLNDRYLEKDKLALELG